MFRFSKHSRTTEWQTIKHGIVFYILLAAVVIPSGIGRHLDHPAVNYPPPVDLHAMLDIAHLWGKGNLSIAALTDAISMEDEGGSSDDPPFHDHVLQAAREYAVDAALIRAIIMVESSFNPQAVSFRGAQGLMQLMPNTAAWLGVKDAFNPAANIDGGVRYFKHLLDRFGGDVSLALAAYNAGSRYVRKYNGVPPFKATRQYIEKVLELQRHYSNEMASDQSGPPAV